MMRDVQSGLIDIIIFIKLDRWFRNVGDYYRTQSILDAHNVKWKSVLEDYDTTTRTGRLNLNIKLTIAEDEAANTSERVKFVLDAKVRNGEPNTGTQPFGYKIEKIDGIKRIIKNPDTQAECEDMFRRFFETKSGYETTRYINQKYGRNHADNTITRRLKNLSYASCTSNKLTLAYRCRYHGVSNCDYKHIVKEKDIEEYLLSNIKNELENYKTNIKSKLRKKAPENPAVYENQLERLNNVYIMGNISNEEYNRKAAELKAKIADLKAGNNQADTIPQDTMKLLSDSSFPALYNRLNRKERRALWASIIDKIKIEGTKPSSIKFLE